MEDLDVVQVGHAAGDAQSQHVGLPRSQARLLCPPSTSFSQRSGKVGKWQVTPRYFTTVYVPIYLYTRIHTYADVCMYACMHACMYACMHVCKYGCMHACMCMYVCRHKYVHIHMYVRTYIHTYIRIHAKNSSVHTYYLYMLHVAKSVSVCMSVCLLCLPACVYVHICEEIIIHPALAAIAGSDTKVTCLKD